MKASEPAVDLCQMDEAGFLEKFGGLYEHSPWIAEKVWNEVKTDKSITVKALASRLKTTVDDASDELKLKLLCAHPELAGRAAIDGTLTPESTDEQARARLDLCTPEEFDTFHRLNKAYNEKFKFPFIMAVRNSSREEILEAFQSRVHNNPDQEFNTALEQVHQIALLRLSAVTHL